MYVVRVYEDYENESLIDVYGPVTFDAATTIKSKIDRFMSKHDLDLDVRVSKCHDFDEAEMDIRYSNIFSLID